jgi:sigma-B regulation protein RsbU (phosphoserine phosphatase)
LPFTDYSSEAIEIQPGDSLVFYTDGVSEAFDINQELFGDERLLGHLERAEGSSARETTMGLVEAVRRHAEGAKQSDDITVLSARYAGLP